jgi:hypothetical protein
MGPSNTLKWIVIYAGVTVSSFEKESDFDTDEQAG